ncbi:MAG TPA: sigma-70 family RNA polymerase sigma factor [Candidatus Dormibacteraeota bacterium]|nr:sigma-70 family RNA polymerase sigma factor [Candidatus Dormibacteraeota bacterium]
MTRHHPSDRSPSPEQLVEELAVAHRHVAVLAAHDVLGDWTLAEDAAQLAFVLILKRLRAGDDDLLDANPEAAVRRNARWAAMKLRRRMLRRADAEQRYGEGSAALVTDHCSRSEARLACETVLRRLPDHYRDAIGLRFFRDLSDGDAAASLDVSLRSYRRRLDRAMAAARSTAQAVGLRGAAALLVTLGTLRALLRRGRGQVADLMAQLTSAWGGAAVNVTALVVIGGAAAAPATTAWAPEAHTLPALAAPVQAGARMATPEHATALAAAMPAASTPHHPAAAPQAARPRTAWEETLDDSQVTSAAAAPGRDGGSGAVVALGWGRSCACPVMLQSLDAGRTWAAAPGPNLGGVVDMDGLGLRIALPPAYPADPRILIGAPWAGPVTDMVADRFGGRFSMLPISGWITLPQSFESDGTMLFSQLSTVVQLHLGVPTGAPLVFQPPLAGTPEVGAPRSGPDSVFVLSDQLSLSGGPGPSTAATRPLLYRCDSGPVCSAVSSPPLPVVGILAVSDRYASDRTIAVAYDHAVVLSRDAGSSFTHLPDPGASIAAMEVTSNALGPVVWATLTGVAGLGMVRWDAAHGWVDVLPLAHRDFSGIDFPAPVLLDADHALLRAAEGLLCTADGGRTWASRCP